MTPETPLAQRVRAALDAAPTSVTARRLLEIDAVDIARAYLDAIAEVERLRAEVEALAEREDEAAVSAHRDGLPISRGRHEYTAEVLREALK